MIAKMFNYRNFDEVFSFDPKCSFAEHAVAEIEGNRKVLEGMFVEKVMKLLGIKRRGFQSTPCIATFIDKL